jgi:hypothetical protein
MDNKIGVLWRKNTNDLIANGVIEIIAGFPTKVSVFKNTKKLKETDPDYNVIISREIPETKEEQKKDNGGF